MKEEFSESLIVILKEMCRRVGATYEDIDFEKEGWFREYEWTENEEEDFKKWLVNYLYNSTKARRELTTIGHKNKKWCQTFADFWSFNYCWKYKGNLNEDT